MIGIEAGDQSSGTAMSMVPSLSAPPEALYVKVSELFLDPTTTEVGDTVMVPAPSGVVMAALVFP